MQLHSLDVKKPDGRNMTLYSHAAITGVAPVPSPFPEPQRANPHLRWHALRGEWVAYAAFRQDRTFQPPPEYNPLAVTVDPAAPTELPSGDYDIAVFENRFPAMSAGGSALLFDGAGAAGPPAPAAGGRCEVVVFTQDPHAALGQLPLSQISLLLAVWGDRTLRCARRGGIGY